jgi:Lon protease-like protein
VVSVVSSFYNGAGREEEQLEHDGYDELAEQRRKKQLTPEGRKLLEEIEQEVDSKSAPEQTFGEILERMSALPPTDQAELVSILGVLAYEKEKEAPNYWEEHERSADLVRSAAQTIQEAQEQVQAAGRAVTPYMTLREAVEVLGR